MTSMISFNISSSHAKALSIFIRFKSLLSSSPIQVNVCVDFHLSEVAYLRLYDSTMMLPHVSLYIFSFDPVKLSWKKQKPGRENFLCVLIDFIMSSRAKLFQFQSNRIRKY